MGTQSTHIYRFPLLIKHKFASSKDLRLNLNREQILTVCSVFKKSSKNIKLLETSAVLIYVAFDIDSNVSYRKLQISHLTIIMIPERVHCIIMYQISEDLI